MYTETTKQGYEVRTTYTATYGDLTESYTILKREKDFCVAWLYDPESGTWAQGHYGFNTYGEAQHWIFTKSNIANM